jgi:hypothetical protein
VGDFCAPDFAWQMTAHPQKEVLTHSVTVIILTWPEGDPPVGVLDQRIEENFMISSHLRLRQADLRFMAPCLRAIL